MKRTVTAAQRANTYRGARNTILSLVILTAVNCVLLAVGSSTYFLSSIFLIYGMMAVYGVTSVTVAVAAVLLGVYLCAFFFSKRRRGWMLAALILFSLDTLCVVGMMFLLKYVGESPLQLVLDLIFHALGIVWLSLGVKNGRFGTMDAEELQAYAEAQSPAEEAPSPESEEPFPAEEEQSPESEAEEDA
ncbi:MAG: hypothetical protein IKI52_08395 [Clostridia bacterium]|nr:hypothetical protein [Clostridia bacterium]